MIITVNGEQQSLQRDSVIVSELLEINKVEMPDMVSVQLNGSFVPRQEFASTAITNGDEVDFLYFMGGGGLVSLQSTPVEHFLKGFVDHV